MKRIYLLVISLFCLILASCLQIASPRRSGGGSTSGNNTNGTSQGSSAVIARINDLAGYLQHAGYTQVGPAIHNSTLPFRGSIAYRIPVEPNTCYAAIAIGMPDADIDMRVTDPYGQQVGFNVLPDANPWIEFCPRLPTQHMAQVQSTQGSTDHYFLLFRRPVQVSAQLATYFSQHSSGSTTANTQATPQQATLDGTTEARVQAVDQQLATEQFTRVAQPFGVVMSAREERQYPLNLSTGFCYAFGTFGGNGTNDTDAFITDGAGDNIVQDIDNNRDALIRFCPITDSTYLLKTRLYTGQGPVFVVGWAQRRTDVGATTSAQNTSNTSAEIISSNNSSTGATLDENFRLRNSDMQLRGYEPYGSTSQGELTQGQTRDFAITLEGRKCYAILAVGDSGIRNLDLLVQDRNGRLIDRDVDIDARPIVRVCPTTSGDQTIRVSMTQGEGHFYYAAYRWQRGTSGAYGLSGLPYVRLGELASLLGVENFTPMITMDPEQGRLAAEGRTVSHRLRLTPNRCYAVIAIGDEGVRDINLVIKKGNQIVAADTSRAAFTSVRVCIDANETYTSEITAEAGTGRYFYQIFERVEQ